MTIDFLIQVFRENSRNEALIWGDRAFSYDWLLTRLNYWRNFLQERKITSGAVCVIQGDFSPNSIALFLALVERSCILVPLTASVRAKRDEFLEIAEAEYIFSVDDADEVELVPVQKTASHPIYQKLRELTHPGLVLFSSGSTGKSKAAVHDLTGILEKFKVRRHQQRTITFLLYDHIGGVNTMFYTLSNAGCIITVKSRNPDDVLAAVEKWRVELLPTSPTFINLLLLSEAYKRHDLSSLKTVTYGTEPMPESILKRFNELFPHITLQQTYGLSELGILRSKSKSSDSLWVKIGGEGFETRVVDGLLEIKAKSAMLGYLNAPSPFTEDGWFKTADAVEVDGEYMKILGRKSEMIIVGGEKVYPAEVESVLLTMEGVEDASVRGEPNSITGQMVSARIKIAAEETLGDFRKRMRVFCKDKLAPYKIPQKVELLGTQLFSERFKKMRNE